MAVYYIKKDNYGFNLTFTVQDADENAFNLTGYTITLKIWLSGGTSLKFSDTCTITDASNGVCTYAVQATDFNTVGKYLGELELTKSGVKEDTKTFIINVLATAPG